MVRCCLKSPGWSIHAAQSTSTCRLNAILNADGSVQIGIRGPVEVLNAGFALDGTEISNGSLRWQGEIGVVLPVPEVGSLLKVEGELQLTDTRVSLEDLELTTSLDTFGWQGLIEFSPARSEDTSLALGVQSDLSATGLIPRTRSPAVSSGCAEQNRRNQPGSKRSAAGFYTTAAVARFAIDQQPRG